MYSFILYIRFTKGTLAVRYKFTNFIQHLMMKLLLVLLLVGLMTFSCEAKCREGNIIYSTQTFHFDYLETLKRTLQIFNEVWIRYSPIFTCNYHEDVHKVIYLWTSYNNGNTFLLLILFPRYYMHSDVCDRFITTITPMLPYPSWKG